jgi:hypothetical protein
MPKWINLNDCLLTVTKKLYHKIHFLIKLCKIASYATNKATISFIVKYFPILYRKILNLIIFLYNTLIIRYFLGSYVEDSVILL